ncbi:VTT domain-containing protein [Streptomyces sp. NPDC000594]|uniref:VTT domain-containing protein n=1 Tax=Streptomyces sp. NPDC000594 TaxID=3154261 RepID=UPI003316A61B
MADAPAAAHRAPTTRTGRILARLDRAAHRPWFLPALAVFPLGDYALPVLPNQMLLMGVSALHPRRWPAVALTFAVASALGAFLAATVVQLAGPWLLETFGDAAPGRDELREAAARVAEHGLWALALLSLLPWTPRVAVLACALAGIPPWSIALTVLAGRWVPMTLLAAVGARAPHLLRRFRRTERILSEVRGTRAAPPS